MTKREKIKLLLRINNASLDFENMTRPELMPDSLKDDPFMKQFREFYLSKLKEQQADLLEQQVDIYDSHLSEDALDTALTYYQTKGGVEFAANTKKINFALAELSATISNRIIDRFHTEALKTSIDETLETLSRNSVPTVTEKETADFAQRHKLEG